MHVHCPVHLRVAEMNSVADMFLEDTGDAALQSASGGQGQLFYPLLGRANDIDRYSAIDKYITHPQVLPIVAAVLGGIENVRFGELNWRGESCIPRTSTVSIGSQYKAHSAILHCLCRCLSRIMDVNE